MNKESSQHLEAGQIIDAPFLPTQAEVKNFQLRTGYALLEIVLMDGSNTFNALRITNQQLAQIRVVESTAAGEYGDAEEFFYFIEANRIRLAYQFDPHLAVSISQVDPLPHQIEAVYHHVLNTLHIRFMIADDPGAGKTIMAGLILKELEYRRLAERILIVAPGHLKYQWQREMKERFGESFAIVDRSRMESAWGENVWEERQHLITSIDFIKQDSVRNTLRNVHWDLVIVDEAHKLSAYAYETRERLKIEKTKRYQAGEVLSRHADHLLFLTATPHRGDDENFRLFLDLLRPGFFARTKMIRDSVADQDNPVFIRRLKEDMRRFDGAPIFPPRHVHTVGFRLSEPEILLYNAVTDYVRNYFDRARENRHITFALMILQRRLTSSTHAIYHSLLRRKARLEELLSTPERIQQIEKEFARYRDLSEDELEDMEEDQRQDIERQLEYLTVARNIEEVYAEIAQLDLLINQAEAARKLEMESKLVGLRDQVLSQLGERKLLIFSEFRDTLDYLTEKLRSWGYQVINIHGQMNMDARIEAEHEFRDNAQIMVATEAAGEGINLQFCSLMVNYDIPWNPNRLEQRMGRIHRYGQNYEVHIWNMVARDTREGQILERLFQKLEKMRQALGSERVYDIIGEVIPGYQLDDIMREAIFNQRRMDEIEAIIDQIDPHEVQASLEQVFQTGLATRHIDYSGIRQESLLAEENRLVPEYVGDYFLRAFRRLGGRVERRSDFGGGVVYRVSGVPYELRRWGDEYSFKARFGTLYRDYQKITFNKHLARTHPEVEFVAPGHPLLEAVNQQKLAGHASTGSRTALFLDPVGQREGVLWFLEGVIHDGAGDAAGRRVFCLYQAVSGEIKKSNPAILWDLEPVAADGAKEKGSAVSEQVIQAGSTLDNKELVEDFVITEVLLPYRDEIAVQREQEAAIKTKYGLRSLDYLIQEANGKILDYQARQALGEDMDLPLLNEQRNLESLQRRRAELEQEIRLERNLAIAEPHWLGTAIVIPKPVAAPTTKPERKETGRKINDETGGYEIETDQWLEDAGVDAERRAEIEAVGMRVALAHECQHGWSPEDVSAENLGFDIRSTLYDQDGNFADIRYIEVKARAQTGAIRLSANEWKKARHFGGKYWLYVITGAGNKSPMLHRIHNPDRVFQMEEDIFATGYIIPELNWQGNIADE